MFSYKGTAWLRAAGNFVSGFVASARLKQLIRKFDFKADTLIDMLNQQTGLLITVCNNLRGYKKTGFWLLLINLLMFPILSYAVPAGTNISNTANVTYNGGLVVNSNTVVDTTIVIRTPSTIEFMQHAPASGMAQNVSVAITDFSNDGTTGGIFNPLAAPTEVKTGTPINLAAPVPLEPATVYHQGEPIFIRLTDVDQNLNALLTETVMITVTVAATGDTEVLRLTETGMNTGVFTGYIQSFVGAITPGAAAVGNGQLGLQPEATISTSYVDVLDGTDNTATAALVDPFGLVFDSSTGQPVDGVQITLINDATGLDANVFGDDGISTFPATIITGTNAVDSGSTVYNFGPGQYRFPFVTPGITYRFVVVTPATHSAPSVVTTTIIQSLPGAPFAIHGQGSRGLPFVVNAGPALEIDIPIDPKTLSFTLSKDANKSVSAIGEVLQYRLALSNNSGAVANAPQVVDTLPVGLRYRSGSTTVNGTNVADPTISANARTLTFALSNIADGSVAEIRYVVDVTITTPTGDSINHVIANANAGALVTNEATAKVRIKNDFIRDSNILMGRVIADNCGTIENTKIQGLAGVRIYLEDGRFVVTDEQGKYHFEDVKSGSHVVQMDLDTIAQYYEPIICNEHTQFSGRTFSRFVDLKGGALWRTDFHVKALPPPKSDVTLELTSGVSDHVATYHVGMNGGDMPLNNMRLVLNLPEGAEYISGSSVLENKKITDPQVNGQILTYKLGKVTKTWKKQLNFLAEVYVDGKPGKMPTKGFLIFNTPSKKNQRTPVVDTIMKRLHHEQHLRGNLSPHFKTLSAVLTKADKKQIKRIADQVRGHKVLKVEVTGHTDNLPIRGKAKQFFADNLVLSVARAKSVGEYLIDQLKLSDNELVIHGMGATKALVPNTTRAGRAKNRRVEVHIVTETMLDASKMKDITMVSNIEVEVEGAWKNKAPADRKTSPEDIKIITKPKYNQTWVESAKPGFEILWPPENYNPRVASIKIAIKHNPAHRLTLKLNGKKVSPLNYDGAVKNLNRTVMVSQWAGVDIEKGENKIVLKAYDAKGNFIEILKRNVKMSTHPVRAEMVKEKSRLIADGKQTLVIAIRMFDKDDRPIREGLIGEFSVAAPHVAQQQIDLLQNNPLSGLEKTELRYRVGKDGIALIELKPTTKTGEATIVLPLENREVKLRPWLVPANRDWIIVGLAEGTFAHNTVSGNMDSLSAADLTEDNLSDGRVAFFAKGSIKGEWLLTLAYDSEKDTSKTNKGVLQEIDPNAYFPVYGDKTTQGNDAQSNEKLYVRLERRQFYALFGDYTTGINVTELSRYNRTLTGLKSELKSDRYEFKLFASQNDQNFVKDEIRGDGTSGLYRMRFNNLILNSEKVVIETRDRFRSEKILSTKPMTRHIDYSIDYDAGTIYFKSPVQSRDAKFNPVYIVIDYETTTNNSEEVTFGGRAAVNFMDKKLEVGVSHINEGNNTGNKTLSGIDTTIKLSEHTELKAEIATSQQGTADSNKALLAEVTHTSGNLEGKMYYRETESGFGLGQQRGSEDGTRKVGIDGSYHISDKIDFNAQIFNQTNLLTNATRDVSEATLVYKNKDFGISAGLRDALDTFSDGTNNQSTQLTFGVNQTFMNNQLKLRLAHDQSLSENASADFPTRTILGADFSLSSSTLVFVEQELTKGDKEKTQSTRIGLNAQPWTGATLNTSVKQQSSEYGPHLFANAGLKQQWQVNDNWIMDASIDNSQTIKQPGNTPFSVNAPAASGSTEDFTAISLGANYKHKTWSWTSRIEKRDSETEDKWGLYSGVAGEPTSGLGISARLQSFNTKNITGKKADKSDLRLGLVFRPLSSKWTILNRADFVSDKETGGITNRNNQKFINNLLLNYRSKGIQISPYYGAKYSQDTIDGINYSGLTDTLGLEIRKDISSYFDIGAHANVLRSHEYNQNQYSYGLSVGFSPATNLWFSLGYNLDGFKDNDFSLAGYTAEGLYLKLRFKFDQQSVLNTAKWFNGH